VTDVLGSLHSIGSPSFRIFLFSARGEGTRQGQALIRRPYLLQDCSHFGSLAPPVPPVLTGTGGPSTLSFGPMQAALCKRNPVAASSTVS
jgi:hypothetical protein